ncbi:MAG: hypothetical protein EB120_10455, partial [Proteobacteria bacterium]|nr:hypothetical protein [Pseudomonadota bacterium]
VMRIGFIGLGKLGLPVALAIESKGHTVCGFDTNADVKKYLEEKKLPYRNLLLKTRASEKKPLISVI